MNIFPREKLKEKGPDSLTNQELLAILLAKGTKKENVFDLSKRLIKNYENFAFKKLRSVDQVEKLWNVGKLHACQIVAFAELAKRLYGKNAKNPIFRSAKIVANYAAEIKKFKQEQCRALYLSTQNTLLADITISIGTIDSSILEPREVFSPAIEQKAASIILIHNHPSGNPDPSTQDMETTDTLKKIGNLLKIPILDHVIIGEHSYFSFETGQKTKIK